MKTRYLLCYDIAHPRRLRRVAQLMLAHGHRVQKSVFECELEERQLTGLLDQAQKLLDVRHDSLRVYRLCPRCTRSRKLIGIGTIPETPHAFIA